MFETMHSDLLVLEYRKAAARGEICRAALLRVEAERRGILPLLEVPRG